MHAILSAFFLQGGVAVMPSIHRPDEQYVYWRYDVNASENPYGIVEAGFDHDWGRWNVSLYGRHISSIPVGDHGTNTVEVSVRVHPFR